MTLAATTGLLYRLWFTKLCTFVDIVGPYSALKLQRTQCYVHLSYINRFSALNSSQ